MNKRIFCFVFYAALSLLWICDYAKAEYFKETPKDQFIDILRHRLRGREEIVSFPTRTRGMMCVEATALLHTSVDEVMELYKWQLDLRGIPFQSIRAGMDIPIQFLETAIEGKTKRITAFPAGDGSSTLVKIISERPDLEGRREYRSVLEEYPELRRIGREMTMERELFLGTTRNGMMKFAGQGGAASAADRAAEMLRGAGWTVMEGNGKEEMPMRSLQKGRCTAQLAASDDGPGRSSLMLSWSMAP